MIEFFTNIMLFLMNIIIRILSPALTGIILQSSCVAVSSGVGNATRGATSSGSVTVVCTEASEKAGWRIVFYLAIVFYLVGFLAWLFLMRGEQQEALNRNGSDAYRRVACSNADDAHFFGNAHGGVAAAGITFEAVGENEEDDSLIKKVEEEEEEEEGLISPLARLSGSALVADTHSGATATATSDPHSAVGDDEESVHTKSFQILRQGIVHFRSTLIILLYNMTEYFTNIMIFKMNIKAQLCWLAFCCASQEAHGLK